jgi:hypothetical protein
MGMSVESLALVLGISKIDNLGHLESKVIIIFISVLFIFPCNLKIRQIKQTI